MFVVYALTPACCLIPGPGAQPGVPFPEEPGMQCRYRATPMTDEFESKDMATLAKVGILVPEGATNTMVLNVDDVVEGTIVLPPRMVSQVGAL